MERERNVAWHLLRRRCGLSYGQIAKRFGVSRNAVKKALQSNLPKWMVSRFEQVQLSQFPSDEALMIAATEVQREPEPFESLRVLGVVRSVPPQSLLLDSRLAGIRSDDDPVDELAESLLRTGVNLVPVVARGERLMLIDGYRRRRAAMLAGLARLSVIVVECSDVDAVGFRLCVHRSNSPLLPLLKLALGDEAASLLWL